MVTVCYEHAWLVAVAPPLAQGASEGAGGMDGCGRHEGLLNLTIVGWTYCRVHTLNITPCGVHIPTVELSNVVCTLDVLEKGGIPA